MMNNTQFASQKRFKSKFTGNALIEYALPASIVVIGAGLLASSMDISQLIGTYFASASGDTLTAGTHVTSSWGTRVTGAQGTGNINWSGSMGSFGNITSNTSDPSVTNLVINTNQNASNPASSGNVVCMADSVCQAAQETLKQEALLVLQQEQQRVATISASTATQSYNDYVANNPNATQAELDAAYNQALEAYNQCASYGGSCGSAPQPVVATITTETATTETSTTGTGL